MPKRAILANARNVPSTAEVASQVIYKIDGAIADGQYHPLSETYATIADAQVDFPAAVTLDDSTDWAALQSAIDALHSEWLAGVAANGVFPDIKMISSPPLVLHLGDGVYVLNRRVDVKGLTLRGTAYPHYPQILNGFASSTNTINGTTIKAIEGNAGFQGSELFNMNPDNSNLEHVALDGYELNHGTEYFVNFFAIATDGTKYTPSSSGRGWAGQPFIVMAPEDPDQYSAEIVTKDLPPIYASIGTYEEFLAYHVGNYSTSVDLVSLTLLSGTLPPGLSLDTNGRIHGTFAPTVAADIQTYSFTVQLAYRVDGAIEDSTVTQDFKIGVVTPYIGTKELPKITEGETYSFPLAVENTDGSDFVLTYTTTLTGFTMTSSGDITINSVLGDVGVFGVKVTLEYLLAGVATGITQDYDLTIEAVFQGSGVKYSDTDAIKFGWVKNQYREVQILVHGQTTGALTYQIDLTRTLAGFENQNPGYPQESSPGTWAIGPGVTFDQTTGLMQGTPTEANRYTFYLKVTDSAGKFRNEPLIVNVGNDASTAPTFFSRGVPPAIKGQAYNFQLNVSNLGTAKLKIPVMPSGLTLDEDTGVISGTPTGVSLVAGVLLRYSAIADQILIRGFLVGIASSGTRFIDNGNSKPSNLHRITNFMIRGCRYGFVLARCFDSHISSGYVAGCLDGLKGESGMAAIRFMDIRFEFIARYGVNMAYANENQFLTNYFDTCGYNAFKAENCKALQIQGTEFFRSGRLVPGTGQPRLPQANRERSAHIRLANCTEDPNISNNTFLVGSDNEGQSNNRIAFSERNYARPATILSTFNNDGLVFANNGAAGCCHESFNRSGDTHSKFTGNQYNYFEFDEDVISLPKSGNLVKNSEFGLNSRHSSYTITAPPAAGSVPVMEFFELRHGILNQDITVTQETISDPSLPFSTAVRIVKLAETGAVAGQTQNLNLSTTNQMGDAIAQIRGRKMSLSFYTWGASASVLTQFVVNSGDNAYAVADFFGPRLSIKPDPQRHHVVVDIPEFDGAEIGKDVNPVVTLRLVLDDAEFDYDCYISGLLFERANDGFEPSPYVSPNMRTLQEDAMSCEYFKSIKEDKYIGESGAGFVNAGTTQFIADGTNDPRVNVVFPVPLKNDAIADGLQIVSFRDAADRTFTNFDSVSQIGGSQPYAYSIEQKNRYGFTLKITSPLPAAGVVLLFHYEID